MIAGETKKTVSDYSLLPEGAPFELIEGTFVQESSPEYLHQDILGTLFTQMRIYTEEMALGKVIVSPMDVYLEKENVFQPDILFVAEKNFHKIQKDGIHGAPDLVIEILSPSNSKQDFTTKLHIYERYGVTEYYIVDPDTKEVIAYSFVDNVYRENYRQMGELTSKILQHQFKF
jgi:Uma2 family endonuclease